MPIKRVYIMKNGEKKPAYRWGNHGTIYDYISGNKKSRLQAYNKATKQAKAAYSNNYKKNNVI